MGLIEKLYRTTTQGAVPQVSNTTSSAATLGGSVPASPGGANILQPNGSAGSTAAIGGGEAAGNYMSPQYLYQSQSFQHVANPSLAYVDFDEDMKKPDDNLSEAMEALKHRKFKEQQKKMKDSRANNQDTMDTEEQDLRVKKYVIVPPQGSEMIPNDLRDGGYIVISNNTRRSAMVEVQFN